MRKSPIFIVGICLAFVIPSFCQKTQKTQAKKSDPVETATFNKTISDYNKFALKFYAALPFKSDNVFICPLSVAKSMAIIYELSDDTTKKELLNAFFFNEDLNALRSDYFYLNFLLKKNKLINVDYFIKENIWLDSQYKIKKSVLKEINKYYGNYLTKINFKKDIQGSKDIIDKWAFQYKINNDHGSFSENLVSAYSKMLILNLINFNAVWEDGFDPRKIEDGFFYYTKFKTKKAKFLTRVDSFYYHENPLMQIIEVPLKNNLFSALFFLPQSIENFDIVESAINHENYYKTERPPTREKIVFKIPFFKIDNKFYLKEVLRKFGIPTVFSDSAKFYNIKGGDSLKINEIYQHAVINVNEKGNKMPSDKDGADSIDDSINKYTYFVVNKPFIFIIRENVYNTILFMGRVFDPIQD